MSATNPTTRQHDDMTGTGTGTGKDALGATTAKVASAAHTAVDIAAENFAHAEKALREAKVAAGDKVSETAHHAKEYSEDALATVKTYIHLYPLRSVGIAIATGYVLSMLLKTRE